MPQYFFYTHWDGQYMIVILLQSSKYSLKATVLQECSCGKVALQRLSWPAAAAAAHKEEATMLKEIILGRI